MQLEELIATLKSRRSQLGITQEDLADLAGVGISTLKNIESGKGNPTLSTLIKIFEVLGLELNFDVKKLNAGGYNS